MLRNQSRKLLLSISLLVISSQAPTSAQVLVQADSAVGQPTIARDERGFSSCGIRAVVSVFNGNSAVSYDFSISAYSTFIGLLKAGRYSFKEIPKKMLPSIQADLPAPVGFWFSLADSGVPMKMQNVTAAENKGFIIGAAPVESAVESIFGLMKGEHAQFAVRFANERIDHVVGFHMDMSDQDKKDLHSCMRGLIDRLSKDADLKK